MSSTQTQAPTGAVPETGSMTRWKVLLGAIIVQLILGSVYGYSIFWTPLEKSVFPAVVTQAQAAQMSATQPYKSAFTIVADDAAAKATHTAQAGLLKYAFSICILAFAIIMIYAGRVQDRKGPRFTATIGAIFLGAGFIIAGLLLGNKSLLPTDTSKLILLWLTVGFLAGAGIGFAYVCPIAALVKWFPKAKGLVSGIAVAGFGFGAYIFSNKDMAFGGPGYIDKHGISAFFVTHGIVCLVAVALGAMLLSNPPGTPAKTAAESDWKGTLRQPAFYMLWLMFFSGALAGLTVIGIVKDFAGEQLVAAQASAGVVLTALAKENLLKQGAAAVGWLAIFNAIGRVLWGLVSDKVGRTGTFVAMFVFQAIMMFILPQMSTETAIAVAACAVGFNFGGNFALFPSATADLFGAKNLGANYGLMFTSYGIAGVVGVIAGNMAKEMTGSYKGAFTLAGGLCILSAILAVILHVNSKKVKAAPQTA